VVIWLQFQTTPTYTVVKTVLPPVSNLAESTPMDFSNINWLAVFVASLSSFVIGAVWFGPKTFYPIWIKAQGREVPVSEGKSSAAEMALMFGGTYVGALAQVATLAVILELAKLANPALGGAEGALLGFVFGVGLGAFASLSHRFFGQPNGNPYSAIKVWLIEVGQDVVCLTIAGLIIGAWA
jgi:Protein of unknown function (DUF1761)